MISLLTPPRKLKQEETPTVHLHSTGWPQISKPPPNQLIIISHINASQWD